MTGSVSTWLAALDEQPGDAGAFDDAVAALVRAEDWRGLLDVGERYGDTGEGRWAQLADALEVVAGQSLEPADRSELLLAIGDVWRHRLGHPEHALQHYQGALRVKRDNVAAIERAREVHREQGTWAMVQRLYQLELRIVRSDEDRARLLTEAGLVQRDGLDDALGAQDFFERALAACPEFAPALKALEGSQEPGEADAYARCQEDLQGAEGDERVALLVRSAELLLEMGDAAPDDPVEALTEARALDPASVPAMQAMAVVLRRRGATEPLRELLEALGRSDAPVDVRVSAALELHAAWRAEGDEASARATLEEALALDAGGAEVVEAARAWYGERGEAERLTSILEEALRRRRGGAQELEWHRELGRLWADELGDLTRAETHYRRVAMMDGEDDAMLRFYVRLYASRGDQKKRIGKLRELRDLSRTDAERFEWSWEMAEVAVDVLEDPVRAVDVWSWYVKRVPDDPRGRQSLRRMLHAAGRWTRLAEFLKGELERLPEDDLDGRVAVHVELAGIYGEHVDLPMLEVQAYQDVLALAPAHTGAVDAVVARWEASQRWLDAAEQLDAAAASTADVDDLERWSRRAAELWATHLSDDARSAESLLRVANAGRGDAELLASLEQLLGASGQDARRVDILRLRAAGADPAERERLLREALDETPEQDARRGLLEDLVLVTEKRDRAAVLELGGLLDAAGDSARALALVEAFVAQLESPTADDLRELGRRSLEAGQFDAAARHYERSLAAEPGDAQAIEGLLQALLDAERWADARAAALQHGAWERAAEALVETGERTGDVERFMDAGALALEGGQDAARAIDLYSRALDSRPGDPEIAEALAVAYAEAGDATGRADMLELLAERASGRERARLQLELASLYEDALGAPSEGLTWRLAALELDPTDPDARADAQQRAREHERLSEWATVVRQGAAVMPTGAARLAVYRELAVVFGDELGNIDNAIDFHQRVLVEVPDDRESLDALADLLVRAERWVDAEPVLEARVASAADEASREVAEARLFAHRIEHLDAGALGEGVHFTSNEALGLVRAALERKELWAAASDLARRQAELAEDPAARFDALASALELDLQGAGLNESLLERAASLLSDAPEPARAGALAKRVMDHEGALGVWRARGRHRRARAPRSRALGRRRRVAARPDPSARHRGSAPADARADPRRDGAAWRPAGGRSALGWLDRAWPDERGRRS